MVLEPTKFYTTILNSQGKNHHPPPNAPEPHRPPVVVAVFGGVIFTVFTIVVEAVLNVGNGPQLNDGVEGAAGCPEVDVDA